jgi:hypothetical protein
MYQKLVIREADAHVRIFSGYVASRTKDNREGAVDIRGTT